VRARTIVVGFCGAAYVLASHWLMTRAPASAWNAVLIIGPMLALLALYAWQRGQRLLGGVASSTLPIAYPQGAGRRSRLRERAAQG